MQLSRKSKKSKEWIENIINIHFLVVLVSTACVTGRSSGWKNEHTTNIMSCLNNHTLLCVDYSLLSTVSSVPPILTCFDKQFVKNCFCSFFLGPLRKTLEQINSLICHFSTVGRATLTRICIYLIIYKLNSFVCSNKFVPN